MRLSISTLVLSSMCAVACKAPAAPAPPEPDADESSAAATPKRTPFCVAHRGQTSATDETIVAQENTWLNIELAVCEAEKHGVIPLGTGADADCAGEEFSGQAPALAQGEPPLYAIEFDIWHTLDGVGVMSHGDGERAALVETIAVDAGSCPLDKQLSEVTWDALASGCSPKYAEDGADMRVLRLDWVLDQLFERNPNAVPVVELKDRPTDHTIETLQAFVTKHPGVLRSISFKAPFLDRVGTKVTPREDYELYLLDLAAVPPEPVRAPFDGIDIETKIPWSYRSLSQQGVVVGTWTANDVSTMKMVYAKGLDFITTDEPAMCFEVVRGG